MADLVDYLTSEELGAADHTELLAWVESLGLDPAAYRCEFGIRHAETGCQLLLAPPAPRTGEVIGDPLDHRTTVVVDIGGMPDFPWLVTLIARSRPYGRGAYAQGARDALEFVARLMETRGEPAMAEECRAMVQNFPSHGPVNRQIPEASDG